MSTILINYLPMREYYVDGKMKGCSRDGSFIPYIAEEIIARSACNIAIDEGYITFRNSIPNSINDRVKWVSRENYVHKLRAYLDPIYEEMYFCHSSPYYRDKGSLSKEEEIICSFLQYMEWQLPEYLMSIDNRLQLEVNLNCIQINLPKLRAYLKNPESRKRIAVLEGIFNSYTELEVPSLVYAPSINENAIELFRRLVSDSEYQELSESCNNLGIKEKSKRSIELMRRKVYDILKHTIYGKLFNHGARAISIANSVYVPETSAAEELMGGSYLPPIISLEKTNKLALEQWSAQNPKFIPMNRHDLGRFDSGPADDGGFLRFIEMWNSRNKNDT